jgi:hypothetical protein
MVAFAASLIVVVGHQDGRRGFWQRGDQPPEEKGCGEGSGELGGDKCGDVDRTYSGKCVC